MGNSGNNVLTGNAGNDTVYGGDGSDTITGGTGDDSLIGGNGSDIYMFNIGDGDDTITEYDALYNSVDKIVFGSGITRSNVYFTKSGDDMIISIYGTGDSITIKNASVSEYFQIEKLIFSDGSVYSYKFCSNTAEESLYDSNENIVTTKIYMLDSDAYTKIEYTYENNTITKKVTTNYSDDSDITSRVKEEYEYDNYGNMLEKVTTNYYSTLAIKSRVKEEYEYDSCGNILEKTTTNYYSTLEIKSSVTEEYTYDTSNNILTKQVDNYNSSLTRTSRVKDVYTYDNSGNILTKQTDNYNSSLTRTSRVTETYTYDTSNNVLTKQVDIYNSIFLGLLEQKIHILMTVTIIFLLKLLLIIILHLL